MKKLMLAALCVLGFGANAAFADALPLNHTWVTFNWGAYDSTVNTHFTFTGAATVDLVDCCIIGDRFKLYDNGNLIGMTDAVLGYQNGDQSNCFSGDACWADSRMSAGSFTLGAGSHDLSIVLSQFADGTIREGGAGFIRATSTSVPEPGSLALFGAGLLGLAMLRRRQVIG